MNVFNFDGYSQFEEWCIQYGYNPDIHYDSESEPQNSDTPLWQCLDEDNIPLSQHRILSHVIWDMNEQLGGVL